MQTNELNIIFDGVFGSGLYGLSTPDSDVDTKGVYVPNRRELIFHNYKDSIDVQTKELDTTYFAVTKFSRILSKCDTISMDMLHTPRESTIITSPLWEEMKTYRSDLYCKNMRGILGYIRTQALKFVHKQDRYKEMKELLSLLEYLPDDVKVVNTCIPEQVHHSGFKFIKYVPTKEDVSGNIDVCGSRYQLNADVSYLRQGLNVKISRYGERTLKGSLSGGDFKSMSHSLRVLIQLDEIIETRDLIFPLVRAPEILEVKLGGRTQESVMSQIDELYTETTEKLSACDLPEESNIDNIEDSILNHLGGY